MKIVNGVSLDISKLCGSFGLRPATDKHSLVALRAYAQSVASEDPELAKELFKWIREIDKSWVK